MSWIPLMSHSAPVSAIVNVPVSESSVSGHPSACACSSEGTGHVLPVGAAFGDVRIGAVRARLLDAT